MAKDEVRNGQREYGIVHVNEEEMREAGDGVFAAKSAGAAPSNKARTAAPADKGDEPAAVSMSMTKEQMVRVARAEGVAVETDDNKADLLAKIEKARG